MGTPGRGGVQSCTYGHVNYEVSRYTEVALDQLLNVVTQADNQEVDMELVALQLNKDVPKAGEKNMLE